MNIDKGQLTDSSLATMGTKATVASSGATVLAGFSLNEVAAITGIVATIVLMCVTLYFKIREDRRKKREHEKNMDLLRSRIELARQGVRE